jgi:8-oxo-dGTP pyrophosphatase MutT (NUDIX family)
LTTATPRPVQPRATALFWRIALTLAFPVYRRLRLWTGRAVGGAFVAIRAPDDVLVVKHSYRPRVDFVGGGIEPGETPLEAAIRELCEEVNVTAPAPSELRELGPIRRGFRKIDEVDILFEWRVDRLPPARVDGREVVWAGGLRTLPFDRREQDVTVRWYVHRYAPQWKV